MHIMHTHTHVHPHSHTYTNKYTYTLTQALVHTPPKRHTTGRYHCPSNRLVRTLATNRGDWSAPSLVFSKPTPPWCCLGVAFALPTLKCGPQVSHVDQPSPFYQYNSQAICLTVTKKPPGQGWSQAWHMGLKAPGFPCTSAKQPGREGPGVAQNPLGSFSKTHLLNT